MNGEILRIQFEDLIHLHKAKHNAAGLPVKGRRAVKAVGD
jgi:hypothetical protein